MKIYKNIPVEENEYKLILNYKKRVGRTLYSIFKEAIKLFIKKYKIRKEAEAFVDSMEGK